MHRGRRQRLPGQAGGYGKAAVDDAGVAVSVMIMKNAPKILMVDDQEANLVALEAVLEELEVDLVRAGSGNEALSALVDQAFTLVLLDVQMPDMDGFEVAELMRGNIRTRTVPIIFVTAISKEKEHVFKGYESGAVDYLLKPLVPAILLSKVRVFLELNQQKEELQRMLDRLEINNRRLKHEIGERIATEQQLKKLSRAIEQSPASVVITDTEGRIEFVNTKFELVTGYTADEVLGQMLDLLKSGHTPSSTYQEMQQSLDAGEVWRGEINNKKKSGEPFWEHISISPIRRSDGGISNYVSVQEDITLRKEYEDRLLHQANYDDITDLPNRILALDRITQESARVKQLGVRMAVLFIDLDDFKKINETMGHRIGDRILAEAADRLSHIVRQGDTVARLGGDEFLMILVDFSSESGAETTARKVLDTFTEPFFIDGQSIVITASIGITYAPDDAVNPHVLMQNAEAAMYRAKDVGRNSYQFFTPEINEAVTRRLTLETHLRKALDNDELDVHFQPILDVKSGRPLGAEALSRWNSPELGSVPPDHFIPVAESTGLIHVLGKRILVQAIEQANRWEKEHGQALYVAVNFSSRQFSRGNLVRTISEILVQQEMPPDMLKMEITERMLIQHDASTIALLQELKEMGIQFSIDDFGTGYSSLSYLKQFPIDTLKIDRSFIRDITDDPDDAVLVKAIIAMAHGLGLQVVAEGVETREQLAFIQQQGCDLVQGYYFSKPLSADEFLVYLEETLVGED
ncbi:MAG: EAL domain-containing protein [Candidatus Thiodiazotropha sp. (ex Troendleina suluensis)]|nr:EAL domain-containing protein [Candidatus Thiodiazotropha sp. (ex Troendleina suluensis)]